MGVSTQAPRMGILHKPIPTDMALCVPSPSSQSRPPTACPASLPHNCPVNKFATRRSCPLFVVYSQTTAPSPFYRFTNACNASWRLSLFTRPVLCWRCTADLATDADVSPSSTTQHPKSDPPNTIAVLLPGDCLFIVANVTAQHGQGASSRLRGGGVSVMRRLLHCLVPQQESQRSCPVERPRLPRVAN